ncbi:MAG: ABC transporter ATP-binding protein [bacterium]|nr:ABC transporter ATP-binding protein [bacterium]
MNAIEFENVSKKYKIGLKKDSLRDAIPAALKGLFNRRREEEGLQMNEFWALKDINFTIAKGEALGIIGSNGAGKSTILKLLAKITKQTKGNININGKLSALIEVGTGFHPDLTGRENIYLNGAIMGLKKKEIDKKFDSIVEFSELEKFIDTQVKRYSSGMYVRLGFSVAAHIKPDILLVDEVLSVGDMNFQRKCLRMIEDLVKNNTTIIFISHNLDMVRKVCSKGIFLNKGEISFYGKSGEAVENYKKSVYELNNTHDQTGETKQTYIKEVKVFDANGKEINVFSKGENIKIRIYFKTGNDINEKFVFGVSLWAFDGTKCFGYNTKNDGLIIEQIKNEGIVELELKNVNLLSDTYLLNVGIWNELVTYPYDLRNGIAEITIKNSRKGVGVVDLDSEWHIY